MKNRGFEVVSSYKDLGINIPTRKTAKSAGYDIESGIDTVISAGKTVLIPTGLKAYMQADEVLYIYIRSSVAVEKNIMLTNYVGVIDADYYGNEENEGHIFISLTNNSDRAVTISKGERIAQGIFQKYLMVDGDSEKIGAKRTGGFGSTGTN